MAEFLVIMSVQATTEQVNTLLAAVNARSGRLILRYPPRVVIVQGDPGMMDTLRAMSGVDCVYDKAVDSPEALGLDEAALHAVQSWSQRMSPEYRETKAARPDEGKSWDFHGAREGGDIIPVEDAPSPFALEEISAKAPPTNTSRYMIGTVAIGVIIVDGPANSSAAFSAAERTQVEAEVQEGATQLVNLSPPGAHLNFVFDVHTVTLALDPATVVGEADWRNPAMSQLGYVAGSPGMYDYIHNLRTTRWPNMCPGPDWGYIAFFTKYNAPWFGYAALGGPRLVIQYSCDGWGPSQIDCVFAHETGHIFGASDEYGQCSTGGSYGYLGVPNNNCEYNNPASIACLMRHNTYSLCQWTIGQFGWRDLDSDGTLDPIDLDTNTYRADVGVAPGNPFCNNADLWIRNADDGEANQAHQNPRSNIDNYIYARVRNFGGVPAEVVRTHFYLSNFTGTEFVFPGDYTNVINAPDTPCPTLFGLTPGASAITKVHLRPAQIPPTSWHPCLLVHVECAQDQPVPPGGHVWDSNKLAQKNLVIDYVAPGQTLRLPIVLQNISAREPMFELRCIKVPTTAQLQIQFPDRLVGPEIIAKPIVERPPILQPIGRATGLGQTTRHNVSLAVLHDTALTLHTSQGQQEDVSLYLAAGSSISWGNGNMSDGGSEASAFAQPFERFERIILPIRIEPVTRFKIQLPPQTRKIAGINFTAPATASIGDEYQFELIQYNENAEPTGGIVFVLRVVSKIMALKEYQWRIKVLQDLGLQTRSDLLGGLADATTALAEGHIAVANGMPVSTTSLQNAFRSRLREATSSDIWEYSASQLAERVTSLGNQPDFAGDLDAISLLLSSAQERLLVEYVR